MAHQRLFFNLLCLLAPLMTTATEPIVTIKQGQLKGVIGTNIDGGQFYKFFGIPYAKPPINELRFKLAQPAEPWTGVRDAGKVGNDCLARDDFVGSIVGSEDCLFLNVYTRNLPANKTSLKPVMVYIHGGGLTYGSSSPRFYGPEFLMLKDIVLVTMNYRLGVLGFLSSDDPALELPGNLGLKDQNVALKWVQSNIRSFNGDPNDVTLFGNSAGGSSIHAHVLSSASKGLFHKAILQSGCALNSWFWGSKNNLKEIVNKTGRVVNTEKEALDVLKKIPAMEIFAAQEQIYDSPYPADRKSVSAVIEIPNVSAFLTKNPVQIIEEPGYNQVPLMMGYMENEGMQLDLDIIVAEQIGIKFPSLELEQLIPVALNVSKGSNASKEIVAALTELYARKSINNRYDPITDGYFFVSIAEALRRHLQTAIKPIYVYRVSLHAELNQLKQRLNRTHEPGVGHTDELGYLFHTSITPPIKPGSLEDRSVRNFVELWSNFAIHGNPTPNEKLNVSWTPVKNEKDLKVLDIGERLEMKPIPERERLESPYPADQRPFSAVIEIPNDAAFLTKNPVQIIEERGYNQVPLMVGYTENEGMLLDLDIITAEKIGIKLPSLELEKVIPVNLNVLKGSEDSKEILAVLKELYARKSVNNRYDPMTDGFFLVGLVEAIKRHFQTAINPIYLYRITLHTELNQLKRRMNRTHEPGVGHSDELGYLFHTTITPPIKPGSLEDRSLRNFVELWTNYAIHGNPTPNEKLNVSWTPVKNEKDLIVLDIGERLEMKSIPEQERLESPYPADQRPFSAVIEIPNEAAFLTKNPVQLIEEGRCNQVPLMLGYADTEGMIVDLINEEDARKAGSKLSSTDLQNFIPINLNVSKGSDASKEIVAALKELYGRKYINKLYDPMTDGDVLVGIIEAIRRHLPTAISPIYLYRVSVHSELNLLKKLLNRTQEPGVAHSDELGYLFQTVVTSPIKPGSLEDRSLRNFVELWTNFAIHGNPTPNRKLHVSWTPVQNERDIKVLDIGERLEVKRIPEHDRLAVWRKILKKWPLVHF